MYWWLTGPARWLVTDGVSMGCVSHVEAVLEQAAKALVGATAERSVGKATKVPVAQALANAASVAPCTMQLMVTDVLLSRSFVS